MDSDSFEQYKQQLGYAMRRLRRAHQHPQVQLEDLTAGESLVVLIIYHASLTHQCVRPQGVARMANTTPSSLSQMLKSLEAKGYITRHRISGSDGADSRGVSLRLTDLGESAARRGDELRDAYLKELFDYLGEDDVKAFVRIVESMGAFFDGKRKEKGGDCACV